jgi:hypothetical protein
MSIESERNAASRRQLEANLASLRAREAALELRIGAKDTLSQDASVENKELESIRVEMTQIENRLSAKEP